MRQGDSREREVRRKTEIVERRGPVVWFLLHILDFPGSSPNPEISYRSSGFQ
jgi:hypothetical protein